MKTRIPLIILSWTCGLGLCLTAAAQPADPPPGDDAREANPPAMERPDSPAPVEPPAPQPEEAPEPPSPAMDAPAAPDPAPAPAAEPAPEPTSEPVPTPVPASGPSQPSAAPADRPAPLPAQTPSPAPDVAAATPATPVKVVADGEKGLRLNFRGAPLEMVLNYLSEAAGFIIDLQTEVRGKVDVWSNQPLTKDEAVTVLNAVLNRNGYAAIRHERLLTIVSKDGVQKRDLPVVKENNPTSIPKSEEMVTQIIPVKFINATSLIKDLTPLLPSQTTMTANEGGNALVITDTQVNIRRMAEIVQALDTAISATSAIRVFPLKYADAKALATVITALFPSQDTSGRGGNNPMQQFFRGMRGDQGGSATSTGSGRVATPKVVATSDERSNSLIVSAPEDQMAIIVDLVSQVDTNVDDVTELRVFHLKYADPEETADMLTQLFPDPTTSQSSRSQFQFGGGRFGGRFGGQNSTESSRLIKQARVLAVPDLRTGSVVVSASRELMVQIAPIIEALDSDPRRKRKVYVFDVENTDPQTVQTILQNLFPDQNSGSSTYNRNTSQQVGNQLQNRATSASSRQTQSLGTSGQTRTSSGNR